MDYYSVFNSQPEAIDLICIAICRPCPRRKQQHIGIYYTSANGATKLLHQPFHYLPLTCDPSDEYIWLDLPLDDDNKMHLAIFCAMIADENAGGIPYSICSKGTGFSKTGKFSALEEFSGLTCATFVMQIFHSQKLEIIDLDSWNHIQPDRVWQKQILQILEQHACKKHMSYQRKRLNEGAARFKPEDVAAAATLPDGPHSPSDISEQSNNILKTIINHNTQLSSGTTRPP